MKQGKSPTKKQKMILKQFGLNPKDWLISKNTTKEFIVLCRFTGRHRTIPKHLIREDLLI